MEKGIKHDQEKTRFDLLESEWLKGVADVMTYGAKKYSAWNWTKLEDRWRVYNSLLRHLFAYWAGEKDDKESGFNHLFHVACNVMMLWGLDTKYSQKNNFMIIPTFNSDGTSAISEETLNVINNLDENKLEALKRKVSHERAESHLDNYVNTENIKIKSDLVAIKWTRNNLEDFKKYFKYARVQREDDLILTSGSYITANTWIIFHTKFLEYNHNKYIAVRDDDFKEKFSYLFD